MTTSTITDKDRELAKKCLQCPVCKHARKTQGGVAFWFVKNIEDKFCLTNC